MVEEFSISLKHREEEMRKQLRLLAPGIDRWLKQLRKCLYVYVILSIDDTLFTDKISVIEIFIHAHCL